MKAIAALVAIVASTCALLLILWIMVAAAIWPWRNPLGNRTTFFTNFPAAMQFKALPQYQEKT